MEGLRRIPPPLYGLSAALHPRTLPNINAKASNSLAERFAKRLGCGTPLAVGPRLWLS